MTVTEPLTILVVGGTGSVGRHVAERAVRAGHGVRILTRSGRTGNTPTAVEPTAVESVTGDLTDADSLTRAVDGIDAVVFTHGTHSGADGYRDVDYGGVANILTALGDRRVRVALMTAIGVTNRDGSYNQSTGAHDWKRRSERLVRVSGNPYTIVRPGWFDYHDPDQHQLQFLQGDRRWAGDSSDGVIARAQIADVLLASLTCPEAVGKTFELVAKRGPAQPDLTPLFAALQPDTDLDGPADTDNQPLADEPAAVRDDLDRLRTIARP